MIKEIALAIIQGLTEFLPISSSGHLALFGNYFNTIDIGYFTLLHLASVIAIIIYTKDEIRKLLVLEEGYEKVWFYLLIGIIPAALFGYFFNDLISHTFSSLYVIGVAFLFTGVIVMSSYLFQNTKGKLNTRRSLIIGISQILALFPGVSRSGTTISFGLFSGLKKEEAFKFSFLMAIPLILGATVLEFKYSSLTFSMMIGFIVCIYVSLYSLKILDNLLKKNYFWVFGIYCILLGIIVLLTHLF